MDDLISRQAAIDAIEHHKKAVLGEHNYDEGIAYGYATAHRHLVDIVKQLPSVQPEIIRCKDCKHWTDENGGFCGIWDHYISNEEFFCGCGERRECDADAEGKG